MVIYAATTIAGALSFLPGGLGVTEGAMTILLGAERRAASTSATALDATLLTRLATLWFAVLLGLVLPRDRARTNRTPHCTSARGLSGYTAAHVGRRRFRLREVDRRTPRLDGAVGARGRGVCVHAASASSAATLAMARPVTMALEATTRLWRDVARTELLGTAVKVSDQQYPRVYEAAKAAGAALRVRVPVVFAAPTDAIKVKVLGTEDAPHLIVNLELAEKLDDTELVAAIGHELGARPERPHPVRDRAALPDELGRVLRALGRAARDHDAAGVVAPRRGHVRSRRAARGARPRQDARRDGQARARRSRRARAFNAEEYLKSCPT